MFARVLLLCCSKNIISNVYSSLLFHSSLFVADFDGLQGPSGGTGPKGEPGTRGDIGLPGTQVSDWRLAFLRSLPLNSLRSTSGKRLGGDQTIVYDLPFSFHILTTQLFVPRNFRLYRSLFDTLRLFDTQTRRVNPARQVKKVRLDPSDRPEDWEKKDVPVTWVLPE